MVSTVERTGTIRTDIRPAGTSRPAGCVSACGRVREFACLARGTTAPLSEDERLVVLTDDALAAGESPDVILLESGASDLIGELIDDQWPRSALLFVGEPPERGVDAGDRVVGAVSVGIEGSRLGTAGQAMAAGLVVIDPELNVSAQDQGNAETASGSAWTSARRVSGRCWSWSRAGIPTSSSPTARNQRHTAKFHVGSLLTKLNAASRAELITNATRRGLLTV